MRAKRFEWEGPDATATAIISRPSSLLPIEMTFTRGVAFSSRRM